MQQNEKLAVLVGTAISIILVGIVGYLRPSSVACSGPILGLGPGSGTCAYVEGGLTIVGFLDEAAIASGIVFLVLGRVWRKGKNNLLRSISFGLLAFGVVGVVSILAVANLVWNPAG